MDKKRYPYRTQFTGADGLIHDVAAKSKKELDEKVRKIKNEIEQGYTPLRASSVTVKKWVNKCLNEYKTDVTAQTLTGYKSKADSWIIPVIGHLKVKDVKPLDCQAVMNGMQGKAADTIRKVKQIMYFCFDKAVENRLIKENPAERLTVPRGHKMSHRAITERERAIILETVETRLNSDYKVPNGRYINGNNNERYRYVYFLFMLFCGCRPSEAAGIQTRDIEEVNGVHILHIRGTKTENADRRVPIPDYLYERIPETASPFDYLFTNIRGGKMSASNRQALWRTFRRDLNITAGCRIYRNALVPPYPIAADLEPYCLRHTYCTDLQSAGIDIRQAMYLMGHADIKLTANIYTHQSDSTIQEIAEKMKNLGKNQGKNQGTNPQTVAITVND